MADTPSTSSGNWDDLTVRIASGAAMTVVGAAGVIMGGVWFQMMVVFVTAVMVWELWMMIRPESATSGMLLAAGLASVMSGQLHSESWTALLLFLVVPTIGAVYLQKERLTYFGLSWLRRMSSDILLGGPLAGQSSGPRSAPRKRGAGQLLAGSLPGLLVLSLHFSPMRACRSS